MATRTFSIKFLGEVTDFQKKATATKRISAVTMRSRMEKGNRVARLVLDLELG